VARRAGACLRLQSGIPYSAETVPNGVPELSTRSRIEWTETTWNPTTGCDRISTGCDHCYALTLAKRLNAMGSAKYQNDGDPRTSGPGFGVTAHPDTLIAPLRWRDPRLVFVNSMSDLFHARVPTEFVARVFAVMAATPQHTYQVLTKRSTRLRPLAEQLPWPPNVWMGVHREPRRRPPRRRSAEGTRRCAVPVMRAVARPARRRRSGRDRLGHRRGESGPGARLMNPAWVAELRDMCLAARVPFFFKLLCTNRQRPGLCTLGPFCVLHRCRRRER
jgi:protein gp37